MPRFMSRAPGDSPTTAAPVAAPVAAAPAADPNVKVITSPMVGTFYAAPSPDSSIAPPRALAAADAWDERAAIADAVAGVAGRVVDG